ncbi:MAG: (Fe-S)-binding protein [Dehalococcoidia bacterium]
MEAFREIGWEIYVGDFPIWVLVYLIAIIALGAIGYALYSRYHLWHMGKPEDRISPLGPRIKEFLRMAIFDGLLHWRFFAGGREIYSGLMHLSLLSGALLLLVGTALDVVSHYWIEFLTGNVYLAISALSEVGGVLLILGIILALVKRYILKPDRLDSKAEDWIAITLVFVIVITGFILEGLRIAAASTAEPGVLALEEWAQWSFFGFAFYQAFASMAENTAIAWYQGLWWFHSIFTFGVAAYILLSFTKLSHIFVGPLNAFFRSLRPKGALSPMPDLEELEAFGASNIEDLTWKDLMDLDACTRCGRCQDNCPAYLSGKALSPMNLVQDLRTAMLERKEKGTEGDVQDLLTEVITEEVIWDCTTCRACQEHCPVFVEHIDKIIEMRRALVMEHAQMPETVGGTLNSIETRGHPWRGATFTRSDWYENLDVKVLGESEDSQVDVLYWVGCTEAVDPRAMKIAQAMVKVMNAAGVNFGILGEEETCCGEPARRMGNEYLFQMQAEQNIEILKGYGIKKIVTACPHGFNTLKNEYPQFGGDFEVVHHTEFIADLIKKGELKLSQGVEKKIAYQDPCYLGRYNDVWDAPRDILAAIPQLQFTEMDHKKQSGFKYSTTGNTGGLLSLVPFNKLIQRAQQKEGAFCCGGGGGRSWMEETGTRIAYMRTDDAIRTNCDVIATSCPFCMLMFDDGIKTREMEETMELKDIAELVAESISE